MDEIKLDLSSATDDELQYAIKTRKRQLEIWQRNVESDRAMIAAYEAELRRRELDAYWQANPMLTPIQDGDKLIVTPESANKGLSDPVGAINTVRGDALKYHGSWGYMVHLDASWGEVFKDLEVVSSMRAAYLADHANAALQRLEEALKGLGE